MITNIEPVKMSKDQVFIDIVYRHVFFNMTFRKLYAFHHQIHSGVETNSVQVVQLNRNLFSSLSDNGNIQFPKSRIWKKL
jgi:hypothetical protein